MIKVTGQQRCRRGCNDKVKVTGQQRCSRGCNDKGNWSVSRDVEEDVMIKVTGQSVEM